MVAATTPLWTPTPERIAAARIAHYTRWLAQERALDFETYHALWEWSADQLGDFWRTLIDYFDIPHSGSTDIALANERMPGAQWFPDVRLNYVEQVFRHANVE